MRRTTNITAAIILLAAAAATTTAQDANILRESIGSRAATLSEMELRPFDNALWTTLEDWRNGPALDKSATDGNVVLIATWAAWSPPATRVLGTLRQLSERHAEEGLIIVGVHHSQGWDAAPEAAERRKVDFRIAHDASGKFREGLRIDQDPDFYLIDRAGQLRYADIRTESVTAAVEQLLAEKADAAAGLRERLAAAERARLEEISRPRTVQGGTDLRDIPEVPFVEPTPLQYQTAHWPERRVDDRNSRSRNQDAGPRTLPLPGGGWISGAAPKTKGRAVVYYGWNMNDTRAVNLTEQMELLQRQVGRDAVVVGVLTGLSSGSNSRRDIEQIDPAQLATRLQRFRITHGITHPMIVDVGGSLFNDNNRSSRNESGAPALVVSSDSIVRWDGPASDDGFRAALNRVIDIDPAIKARRAAESAFIGSRTGG